MRDVNCRSDRRLQSPVVSELASSRVGAVCKYGLRYILLESDLYFEKEKPGSMDISGRIAAVLGPTLIVVTTSEFLNLRIWANVHPTVVYLNGLLFLIGGLIIVTSHNLWFPNFSLLVTLSGWLLVFAGSFRMFFPTAQQLAAGWGTYLLIASLLLLGVALTVYAFLRPSN